MKRQITCVLVPTLAAALALAACGGDAFTSMIPDGDAGCCPDTATGTDSGNPSEGGNSPDGADANQTDGNPGTDSGQDSGCMNCPDAAADTGTDAGSDASPEASTDSGLDAGVDSGLDSGTDSGMDSGLDSGLDGGADSGDAGCIISSTMCSGDQPMICDGTHTWVNNGGTCTYGCQVPDSGTAGCKCDAPGGRLTVKTVANITTIDDSVTGYHFATVSPSMTSVNYSTAVTDCSTMGGSWHLPTRAELRTLLSQLQSDNTACTPDNDSAINNTEVWWTKEPYLGGHYVVNFNDGTEVFSADVSLHRAYCIQ